MQCKRVNRKLNALVDGELQYWTKWRVNHHLAGCVNCATDFKEIQKLSEQVGDWLSVTAPATLKGRIASAVFSESPPKPASHLGLLAPLSIGDRLNRKRIFAIVGVCLAIVAIWAYITKDPTALAAMKPMETAVRKVKSAHVRFVLIDSNGNRFVERELWFQAGPWRGRWRLADSRRGIQIYRNLRLWNYDSQKNVLDFQLAFGPPGRRWSGFSFSEISRDMIHVGRPRVKDWTVKAKLKQVFGDMIGWGQPEAKADSLGTTKIGGREVAQYLIDNADDAPEPVRLIFLVDAATDLPISVEKQHRIGSEWITRGILEFEFNQLLPEQLFDPNSLLN
jgi:Putative zinc-finger